MNSTATDEEDFPYSSPDQALMVLPAPPAAEEIVFTAQDYRTALRVLVGAALEGSDEFSKQVRTWLDATQKMEQEIGAPVPGPRDMDGRPLLYSLIGLLFKTPEYLDKGLKAVDPVFSRTAALISWFSRPVSHSRLLRPVRQRYADLVERGEAVVDSLEANGRSEASFGRLLVRRQVSEDRVEEALVYLVEKSKMREMIVETSAQLGGDAMTEIRGASATVDNSLDNLVDKILKRQKPNTPPAGSSS